MLEIFKRWSEDRSAAREEKRQHQEQRVAEQEAYEARLVKAASVSSVTFVCHKDTWDFIDGQARQNLSYRQPSTEDQPGNMVKVHISGPNLVTILIVMGRLSGSPWTYVGNKAIATRVYDAASEIVDAVDPSRNSGTPLPPIVIDAEIAPPDET